MKPIRHYLLFLFLLLCFSGQAQSILMRLAEHHSKQKNYADAVEIYKKVLDKYTNHPQATIELADAYRKMNNREEAIKWYKIAVSLEEAPSIAKLHYAQLLQKNNQCTIAKIWYERFADENPDDNRGQYLRRACDYTKELENKNDGIYVISELWFNSDADEFSPAFYEDGIIFSSDRPLEILSQRSAAWDDRPFLNLFKVKIIPLDTSALTFCNYMHTNPLLLNEPLNSKFHEGSTVFSADEQEVFITRSKITEEGFTPKGSNQLSLYHAKRLLNKWTTPEPVSLNDEEFSIAHPALSPDGRYLYFASDKLTDRDDMDLYRVPRHGVRWGDIENLGDFINTEGNEAFPTFDAAGRLFFASDGQIGLGGLDIYAAEELEEGVWSIPENMGAPINSTADDFGIIFSTEGTCGYFTSNRQNEKKGDNIYSFSKTTANMQVLVYDDRTNEPLKGVQVRDSCTQNVFFTNTQGKVVFDMPLERCCTFFASFEGYDKNSLEGCTNKLSSGDQTFIEIPLRQQLTFELTGIVFDQHTGLPLDESNVYLTDDCTTYTKTAKTDASGRFTFTLQENCCYYIQTTHKDFESKVQEGYCTKMEESKVFVTKVYLEGKK